METHPILDTKDTINIDTPDFFNPFEDVNSITDEQTKMMLYMNYFRSPTNQKYLQMIGDKNIYTNEKKYNCWNRSEILQSLSCYFGYRRFLTISSRNILDNKCGIITHVVDVQGEMDSGLGKIIKNRWPIVFEKFKQLRVKFSGAYQLIKVSSDKDKYSLYVCTIFDEIQKQHVYGSISKSFRIKRALRKLNKIRKRNLLNGLPIYFSQDFGKEYEKYIFKYCSDAILCSN